MHSKERGGLHENRFTTFRSWICQETPSDMVCHNGPLTHTHTHTHTHAHTRTHAHTHTTHTHTHHTHTHHTHNHKHTPHTYCVSYCYLISFLPDIVSSGHFSRGYWVSGGRVAASQCEFCLSFNPSRCKPHASKLTPFIQYNSTTVHTVHTVHNCSLTAPTTLTHKE